MIAEHRFPLVSVPGRASVRARCQTLSFSRHFESLYRPTEQNLSFFLLVPRMFGRVLNAGPS
jgi:hypothetical protein